LPAAGRPGTVIDMAEEERDGVRLTSLDKPLGDGLEVTKGDLIDYVDVFADRLLPQLEGRPLSVKRVRPGQEPFMQRNVSKGAPDWVRTAPVWSFGRGAEVHQVLCDDRRTLLWLANQRAVEFHVPFFRAGHETEPTGLVIDLDPPEGADFAVVVQAAGLVRRALEATGLTGAVKTSGSKGVHVVVPVRGSGPEDVAAATRALAARAAALDPDLATTAYIKEDRHGRVFLDSTRSGSSTIVAAYSPRLRPGLPVSTPVAWDALPDVRPGDVTVRTAAGRIGDADPWRAALPEPQQLPGDLVAEGHTIPVARVAAMHEGKRRKRAAQAE
jgi:DNA ligase D-like protein (predicted polymerase)